MSDKITEEKKIQDPELAPVTSQLGEVYDAPGKGQDAVFGDLGEDGPKYRNVCAFLEFTFNISTLWS